MKSITFDSFTINYLKVKGTRKMRYNRKVRNAWKRNPKSVESIGAAGA